MLQIKFSDFIIAIFSLSSITSKQSNNLILSLFKAILAQLVEQLFRK